MRLWSLHPCYLDSKGIVALWREALLARKVLQGLTKGYKNHPQLIRFKDMKDPPAAIDCYLLHIADEADRRQYNFNKSKITGHKIADLIMVTRGQLDYEFRHLCRKLKTRDPSRFRKIEKITRIRPHPMFRQIRGGAADWEIIH